MLSSIRPKFVSVMYVVLSLRQSIRIFIVNAFLLSSSGIISCTPLQDFSGISPLLNLLPQSQRIISWSLKMYVVESKGGAIVCMLLALLFLGTWPAVLTLLERRGRLPQHTYLDYSITNLLAAVIIALTFGEIGKGTPTAPNFFTQLSQVSSLCI